MINTNHPYKLINEKNHFITISNGSVFHIHNMIGTSASSSLYQAQCSQNGSGTIVKLLNSDTTYPDRIEMFQKEYEIMQSLDVAGIVKPVDWVDASGQHFIVLDNVNGESFEVAALQRRLGWRACVQLACQLAHILSGLHASHFIHKDIRPSNFLLGPSQKLWLMDLSHVASDLLHTTATDNNQTLKDWSYISPEQTGRINRAVDYRTDFYSLGVMLYQVISGQLPFYAHDALEWAHCHIARLPRPPAELNSSVPPMVSAIIMKLLEKMPEERYQSTHGLLHDLETCLAQDETNNTPNSFTLGSQDWPQLLQISPKLVGRDTEVNLLLASFNAMRAVGQASLLLVSGCAGVGKSALVQELKQPVAAQGGYFISGKFDQYQHDIPYATVTLAFRELVQLILSESEVGVTIWRDQIQSAIGANGRLIVDILPQVALIIGPQVSVPILPAAEAQNRFLNVFKQFIGVFAQSAHPLVLFLDDLQWADLASLRLVEELLALPNNRSLLVVGAYRDNEVNVAGAFHPLKQMMEKAHKHGTVIQQIALLPISEQALCTFLGDTLHCQPSMASSLGHLIYQKTHGNPFFQIQFIRALEDEHMFTFNAKMNAWCWDLAKIEAKSYTDNIVELMVYKLAQLPISAQNVLQRLACLGICALETTLVKVCCQPNTETHAALIAAVHAGLLLHSNNTFTFIHDRVQEAAYQSIPYNLRGTLHLQIGRLLIVDQTPILIEESIFSIVSQFNLAKDCITEDSDRELLLQLNFLAGKKAKSAIAYAAARGFLTQAFAQLPLNAWQLQYQQTFALTLALSECEYLVGEYQRADELANLILANAKSDRDRASVYRLRMQLYQMAGRFDEALTTMFEAADLLGINFPAAGQKMEAAIDAEVSEIAAFVQGRRINDFVDAPVLVDPDQETIIALLVEAIPAAYLTRPDYFALITAKATKLSMHFGCTEEACFAYSTYGMALLSRQSDIATAFEYSELALRLNHRFDGRRLKGRVLVAHALAFSPWKNSFSDSTAILDQSFAASIEVGDLLYANFSALFYCWPMLQQGTPLDTVLDTARMQGAFAYDNHNDAVYQAIRFQQQLAANLKGQTRGPESLDDDTFDESICYTALEKANMGFGLQMAHIVNQISAFIYGDYKRALAAAQRATLHSYEGNGMILIDSAHHFYFALTLAALYSQASHVEQRYFNNLLAEELERHRVWAEYNPQNFLHSYALVGAEIARIEGRESDAERLYEKAIRSAQESGLVQNEAIAFEVASKFYQGRGFDLIAEIYLYQARIAYQRWGADGKVTQLDANYPQLSTRRVSESNLATGSVTNVSALDVLSIVKASQAISGQLVLNELADTLLHIVLENAGAQTGSLLLCGSEGLELAAKAYVDQTATSQAEIRVRFYDREVPAELSLPFAILNLVRRSREPVLLLNVAHSNSFSADPYFSQCYPKSVLCLPIVHQDKLIGLLYLENNSVTHAFTPQHVLVLELIASQAAISLENVQLYANLMRENLERKRAEESLRLGEVRIRRLIEANIIGVIFVNMRGNVNEANDAFLELSGFTRQDLYAGVLRWTDLTPSQYSDVDKQAIEDLRKTGIFAPYEKEFVCKDGSRIPVLIGGPLIEGEEDQAVCFVVNMSARKQAEEQVHHMANHDAMTGLPNRLQLLEHIKLAIAYAHRNHSQLAILFIDLDHFKNINDSLGHHIGDVVLQMTARRLQSCLREGDKVARLGGDEFVVTLALLHSSSDAATVAQKVLDVLAKPFTVETHELQLNSSIGISLYPDDGTDVNALMRTADTAMYHAKKIGRGNFQFFTPALNEATQQRLIIGARLRKALAENEFVLHYQPQVNMETGMTFSVEALLRWQPPFKKPSSCGAFIANAEESGLIIPIGEWVIRQACNQLKVWHDAGHPTLKMAVNLSTRQVEQTGFCDLVAQVLEETGVLATSLELEITESIMMQRSEATLATLTRLNKMGIQLSMDDFGTGYSSLSYLQHFPIHALKIDQSFIREIGNNLNDTALIIAIIGMANSLHLKVIAEGVETLQQAHFLVTHGCVAAQGFYFSEAVSSDALLELLNSNTIKKVV